MDDRREAARRFVQRKRRFSTILGIYLALSLLWFTIDMLTGTDDLWFHWPMLGAGLIVAVIGTAMFGIGGLLGSDWERRQVDRYLERRSPENHGGNAQADQRPSPGWAKAKPGPAARPSDAPAPPAPRPPRAWRRSIHARTGR
jgi:hypothetical protein